MRADGTATHSLNHYSKGAVISFLHRYVAGLQLVEPGLPALPGRTPTRRRHHQRPHAPRLARTVASRSPGSIDGGTGRLDVTVPGGTEAELLLPDGTSQLLAPGTHDRTWV